MHIGKWLRDARIAAGLSLETATFELRALLPPVLWVSVKTVHRLESNPSPDPVLAGALAKIYGKSRQDMPPELVKELDQVEEMLSTQSPCIVGRAA